ncbi:MAG: hypothetical protein FJW80_07695 [Actinobacteria bacterium]|nr:hypothetical protein [Actinomycetota bacterium]
MSMYPTVVIVRHAEKPESGGPHGVDHHGSPSGRGLTPRGWSRSGALAVRMAHAGGAGDVLPKPEAVYATGTDAHHESDRPRLTAHVVADRLQLHMLSHLGRGDEAKLVKEVVAAGVPTLIVWDHGHIPTLTKAFPLVSDVDVPEAWPEDRFDLFWLLTPSDEGYTLTILPQELLAGDASTT